MHKSLLLESFSNNICWEDVIDTAEGTPPAPEEWRDRLKHQSCA